MSKNKTLPAAAAQPAAVATKASAAQVHVMPNLLAAVATVPLSLFLTAFIADWLSTPPHYHEAAGGGNATSSSVSAATDCFSYGLSSSSSQPSSLSSPSTAEALRCVVGYAFDALSPLAKAAVIHVLLGAATLAATLFVAAPYGSRLTHNKGDISLLDALCRWSVAATPSWILQELPTLVAFVIAAFSLSPSSNVSGAGSSPDPQFYPAVLLFLCHYVHRTLVFPWFLVNGKGHFLRWRSVGGSSSSVSENKKGAEGGGAPAEAAERKDAPIRHNPLLTVLLAALYCSFNGALQVAANTRRSRGSDSADAGAAPFSFDNADVFQRSAAALFGETFGFAHIGAPRVFAAGALLFFLGMYINVTSDYYMFSQARLRERQRRSGNSSNSGSGYIIPKTFWYSIVAAPNYFGELVEWFGYAVALLGCAWGAGGGSSGGLSTSSSISFLSAWAADVGFEFPPSPDATLRFFAALSFVFYTFANLAPRAVASRQWYRDTFGAAYTTRWAVIPFVW